LVVEPGDASALAGALNSLVADPALRERFGARARQRVEETFTMERMASQSAALYREVIGSSPIAYRQSHRSIDRSSMERSSIARSIDSIDRSIDAIGDER
jgi:hypothetical protein